MKYLLTLHLFILSAMCASAQLSFNQIVIASGLNSAWPQNMKSINGKLYFMAYKSGEGNELWTSDGTQAGTQYIKDINPGTMSSNPIGFVSIGGKVYFKAEGPTRAIELWETDGTTAGTKGITQPTADGPSILGDIHVLNGKMYFLANTKNEGTELWESDGTTAGTKLLKDIEPGPRGSDIRHITNFNNKLYFAADNGTDGEELWSTDGTAAGTLMVLNININSANAYLGKPMIMNNLLYFTASDATGRKLFSSDGTAAGTSIVAPLYTSTNYPFGEEHSLATNNRLYFAVNSPTYGSELWTSDGTTIGTHIVKDIVPGSNSSNPARMIAYNNKIYFSAGRLYAELYSTDGTDTGTIALSSFEKNGYPADHLYDFTIYNGLLYFVSHCNWQNTTVLYATGTNNKLQSIKPTSSSATKPIYSSGSLCLHDTSLCIAAAFDNTEGNELWIMNGTINIGAGIANSEQKTNSCTLYPNPTNNVLHITTASTYKTASITISNAVGQIVLTENITYKNTISLQGIAPGIYTATIDADGIREAQQITIQ